MVAAAEPRRGPGMGAVVAMLAALLLVTCAIALVFLGMRSVMDVGGACADGGPYESVQPCPRHVPGVMIGAIWGGIIFAGVFVVAAIRVGGSYVNLIGFAWPGLFLSLGWNFLQYGLDPAGPDQGPVWGWLICAIVFVLMGAVPLFVLLRPPVLRRTFWPPDAVADVSVAGGFGLPTPGWRAPPVDVRERRQRRLEALDALRASGALEDAEYDAARQAVLDEATEADR